uniref:Uncharacterized protein n=2 Tax=Parascaris univalens TaxID=6257 RepID=A0A915ATP5_PARUN
TERIRHRCVHFRGVLIGVSHRMVRELTIAVLASVVIFICYKQAASSNTSMTARSAFSALHSVVYVTVPNITVAKQIAREVVSGKLAACVNIIPSVTSVYEWEGKLEEESELLLIMKTRSSAIEGLRKKVLELHPYEVPEFIAAPITSGSDAYLKWVDEQVE